MKRIFLSTFTIFLTFSLGIFAYRNSTPRVSIEKLTQFTYFYDGMDVEVESFLQISHFDENIWTIGEPFEKKEATVYLEFDKNKTSLEKLRSELSVNLTKDSFRRAKVVVKGKLIDNCSGTSLCCFGQSMRIKITEIRQIEAFETYQMPQ